MSLVTKVSKNTLGAVELAARSQNYRYRLNSLLLGIYFCSPRLRKTKMFLSVILPLLQIFHPIVGSVKLRLKQPYCSSVA